jgi:hypothetical protein
MHPLRQIANITPALLLFVALQRHFTQGTR